MKKTNPQTLLPLLMVAVVAGVAVFYLTSNPHSGILPSATFQEESIKKFSSYDEMKSFLQENVGSSYGGLLKTDVQTSVPAAAESSQDSGTRSNDYSGTNVQVQGVDEADIVKTDGEYIYNANYNNIFIVDAVPANESKIVSEIEFPDDITVNEILVSGDRMIVFATRSFYYIMPFDIRVAESLIWPGPYQEPKSFVYVYDLSDRSNPTLERNVTVDGSYVDSRMIGSRIYAVVNSPVGSTENITTPVITDGDQKIAIQAPDIYYFPQPDYSYGFTTILSLNAADAQDDVSSRVILMGASQHMYVSADNIYVAYQNEPNYYDYAYELVEEVFLPNVPQDVADDIRTIEETDLNRGAKFEAISSLVYDYLNTLEDDERSGMQKLIEDKYQKIYAEMEQERQKSIVHRIEIDGGSIEYRATGEVRGALLNQFSMDEHEGYFRVATTTRDFSAAIPVDIGGGIGNTASSAADAPVASEAEVMPQQPTSLNHVYVLDMNLNVVGSLENIAPDENIYSARFMGDRAYLVTFEQVDPFFVIDMSNPTQPAILGKLKIPGFSNYLHPYDESHIIGLGMDTTTDGGFVRMSGVKMSLFDVTDVNNPREISSYKVGGAGSYSEALYEHKAFLFSKEKGLIVIPMSVTGENYEQVFTGAYAFSIDLENGIGLHGTVEHDVGDYGGYVRRSLYIGDVLYTVSDEMIKANSLSDFSEISEIDLPSPYPQPLVKTDPVAAE